MDLCFQHPALVFAGMADRFRVLRIPSGRICGIPGVGLLGWQGGSLQSAL